MSKFNNPNKYSSRINSFDKRNPRNPVNPINPINPINNNKLNAILIVLDQAMSYELLPPEILNYLPGYQAFSKIGINFTNSFCNRTACSASRAVIQTGCLNTGIQDTIHQDYQRLVFPCIDPKFETIGKLFKSNNYKTAYFGKYHLDSKFYSNYSDIPIYGSNTRYSLREQGFDQYNTVGDFEPNQHGMLSDTLVLQSTQPPNSIEFDYYDIFNNIKLNGIIPYLKARGKDNKNFYTEVHFTNPHDIVYSRSDLSQMLHDKTFLQFWYPFCDEQCNEFNIASPYYFNEMFKNAYISNPNFTKNYFEKTYDDYKLNMDSLPFSNSFKNDFVTDPINNGINPLFVANYKSTRDYSTIPDSQEDIKGWKNLINSYYGLFIESDSYVYQIFLELQKQNLLYNTNVIITSDHGEGIGGHGQRNKAMPFNEQINIISLMYSPNILPQYKNIKSKYINSSIDIVKTFIDINNLQIFNNNSQLKGESLFKRNNLNFLIPKTINDNPNKKLLFIFNGNEAVSTYFYYKDWYDNSSETIQQDKVIGVSPTNIFNFKYNYVFVQTIINNKLYKFGYYYSMYELFKFNITYKNLTFTKTEIIENIPLDSTNDFNKYLSSLEEVLYFDDLYNHVIQQEGSDKDTANLYSVVSSIIKTYYSLSDSNKKYLLYIPYFNSDFDYKKSNKISMLCYNLTDDLEETINLLDDINYSSSNDSLFSILNESLNMSLIEQDVNPLFTIIPYDTYIDGAMSLIQDNENVFSETLYDSLKKLDGINSTAIEYDGVLLT